MRSTPLWRQVYSPAAAPLLVGASTALESAACRIPACRLTPQELIYAASALRVEARRAEKQAADPAFHPMREGFEKSAKAYD